MRLYNYTTTINIDTQVSGMVVARTRAEAAYKVLEVVNELEDPGLAKERERLFGRRLPSERPVHLDEISEIGGYCVTLRKKTPKPGITHVLCRIFRRRKP